MNETSPPTGSPVVNNNIRSNIESTMNTTSTASKRIEIRDMGHYLEEASLVSPAIPQLVRGEVREPSLTLELDTTGKSLGGAIHASTLALCAVVESKEIGTIFRWNGKLTGIFSIENASPEEIEHILNVQCATLLFPFLRQILAQCTRDGGLIPPIMIEPVDFDALYEQKLLAAQANT